MNELPGFRHFYWPHFTRVKENPTAFLLKRFKAAGIQDTNCYTISEDHEMDTEILELSEALNRSISKEQTSILIFGNGDIICFSDPGTDNCFINHAT